MRRLKLSEKKTTDTLINAKIFFTKKYHHITTDNITSQFITHAIPKFETQKETEVQIDSASKKEKSR